MTRTIWIGAMLLAWPGATHAACTLSSTGVAFGVYNPVSTTAKDATGTVTLTCTADSGSASYDVKLSPGGGGASYAARRMASGANFLPYQLFRNSARTQIWGDGTASTFVNSGNSQLPRRGGTRVMQVYGRIASQLTVNPGAYTDVVIATVTY